MSTDLADRGAAVTAAIHHVLQGLTQVYPEMFRDADQCVDATYTLAQALGIMLSVGVDRVDGEYKAFERAYLEMARDHARARIRETALSKVPDPGLEKRQ